MLSEQACIHADRHADRRAVRHAVRQAGRQAGRWSVGRSVGGVTRPLTFRVWCHVASRRCPRRTPKSRRALPGRVAAPPCTLDVTGGRSFMSCALLTAPQSNVGRTTASASRLCVRQRACAPQLRRGTFVRSVVVQFYHLKCVYAHLASHTARAAAALASPNQCTVALTIGARSAATVASTCVRLARMPATRLASHNCNCTLRSQIVTCVGRVGGAVASVQRASPSLLSLMSATHTQPSRVGALAHRNYAVHRPNRSQPHTHTHTHTHKPMCSSSQCCAPT